MILILIGIILLAQLPLVGYLASVETSLRTNKRTHISNLIALSGAFVGSLCMFGFEFFEVGNASLFFLISSSIGLAACNLSITTEKRTRGLSGLIIGISFVIAVLSGGLIGGFSGLIFSWSIGGMDPQVSKSQLAMLSIFPLTLLIGNYLLNEKRSK